MKLVHKETRQEVKVGDELIDFRGEKSTCVGWQEPQHPGSTGRVYVSREQIKSIQFYPSVFNLEWVSND
jgi:hypothetical protein